MRMQTAVMLCVAALGGCYMMNSRLHPLPPTWGRTAMLEAPQILVELANQCEGDDVSRWQRPWAVSVRVRGVAGQYRINRELRVGFWPAGSAMRIESVPLSGPGSFVLLANRASGAPSLSLLLQNGLRIVRTERAAPMFEKLLGAPLTPFELEALLRGCFYRESDDHRGGIGRTAIPTLYGADWVSVPFSRNGRALFRRDSAGRPWQATTLLYPGRGLESAWRLDYHDIHERVPHRLSVTGIEARNVQLDIIQSGVLSASLPEELFAEPVSPASQPMALDDVDLAQLLSP